jgi:hypothetical protein
VPDHKKLLLKIALTFAAVACVVSLAFSRTFYDEALSGAFFSLALGSVVILHLRVRPRWLDATLIAIGTAVAGFVAFDLLHFPTAVMAWFSFAGLSSFLILAIRAIWDDVNRRMLLYACIPAALFAASDYFATAMLQWTADAHPKTLDVYLMMFDSSLRFQPAFALGKAYAVHPWLHTVSLAAYIGLAVPITIVYAGRLVKYKEKSFPAMLAFLMAGPAGILFYNLFPAAGPHNLFGAQFPFSPIPTGSLARVLLEHVAALGPRNAMPSLHLAWTLLAWWCSRNLSRTERTIAFLFLALTAFATLGTGEHWLADLVVAFPFALMIRALSAYDVPFRDVRRHLAFGFGLFATLTWLLLLRYCTRLFWTSPLVPWSLVAGTIALTMLRQRMLSEAQEEPPTVEKPQLSALPAEGRLRPIPAAVGALDESPKPASLPA